MYKEYRDVSVIGAIEQMYLEMAGSYKVRWSSIIVLRTEELSNNECIKVKIKQYHGIKTSFPIRSSKFRNIRKFQQNNFTSKGFHTMLKI